MQAITVCISFFLYAVYMAFGDYYLQQKLHGVRRYFSVASL